jgi:hypothetical protein
LPKHIHLKPYSASEKQIESVGRYAERVAIKTAADIYGGGVVVDVEIEEGSLLTHVTVVVRPARFSGMTGGGQRALFPCVAGGG